MNQAERERERQGTERRRRGGPVPAPPVQLVEGLPASSHGDFSVSDRESSCFEGERNHGTRGGRLGMLEGSLLGFVGCLLSCTETARHAAD